MIERVVIQTNSSGFADTEAFVEHVCDHFGITFEFGIVSSSVLSAVAAISHMQDDAQLAIEMGECEGGVYCKISSESPIPADLLSSELPDEPDMIKDNVFTIHCLADLVTVSDDNKTLRMDFILQGVASPYACQRQQTLKKYFASRVVEA